VFCLQLHFSVLTELSSACIVMNIDYRSGALFCIDHLMVISCSNFTVHSSVSVVLFMLQHKDLCKRYVSFFQFYLLILCFVPSQMNVEYSSFSIT
jgi:hypothetical protein